MFLFSVSFARLLSVFNPSPSLQALETCVKNCGHRFHVQVATRDFIEGVLVKVISPKNNPPTIVQDKVLALIQVLRLSWLLPFQHYHFLVKRYKTIAHRFLVILPMAPFTNVVMQDILKSCYYSVMVD